VSINLSLPAPRMVSLTLPERPLSSNNVYRNVRGNGRALTPEAKAWKLRNTWTLRSQLPPAYEVMHGRVLAVYRIERHQDKRRRDIENLAKLLSDTLVAAGVMADDSQIDGVDIAWSDEVSGTAITLREVG